MDTTIVFIVGVPAILIAIVVHEFCHGLAAYLLGDNTAKDAGRLTLNPIPHIDLWGTIIIPLIMLVTSGAAFGWAGGNPGRERRTPIRLPEGPAGNSSRAWQTAVCPAQYRPPRRAR